MKSTTDIRDELFRDLTAKLEGDRWRVHESFRVFGPCTTRRAAEATGMDVLNVRPRATELLQAGLLELAGKDGHEGVYAAVSAHDAARRAAAAARPEQMFLL